MRFRLALLLPVMDGHFGVSTDDADAADSARNYLYTLDSTEAGDYVVISDDDRVVARFRVETVTHVTKP